VLADFFLLKKPKWGLAGQSLDQGSFKNALEGVRRCPIAVGFAAAFRSLKECCKTVSASAASSSKTLEK
jgi:hypothetical protein